MLSLRARLRAARCRVGLTVLALLCSRSCVAAGAPAPDPLHRRAAEVLGLNAAMPPTPTTGAPPKEQHRGRNVGGAVPQGAGARDAGAPGPAPRDGDQLALSAIAFFNPSVGATPDVPARPAPRAADTSRRARRAERPRTGGPTSRGPR